MLTASSCSEKNSNALTKEPSHIWSNEKDGMKGVCGDITMYTVEKL